MLRGIVVHAHPPIHMEEQLLSDDPSHRTNWSSLGTMSTKVWMSRLLTVSRVAVFGAVAFTCMFLSHGMTIGVILGIVLAAVFASFAVRLTTRIQDVHSSALEDDSRPRPPCYDF